MIHLAAPTTAPTAPTATGTTTAALAHATELFVCPFSVWIDTREQSPWCFSGITHEKKLLVIRRERVTLTTGDYTISGCEDRLCIERKSAADFVQSVTREAVRFKAEHERMQAIAQSGDGGLAAVVVEGSLSAICDDLEAEAGRRVTPDMILGACAAWPARYGVHWFFAGDRRRAELLAWRIMWRWWCEVSGIQQSQSGGVR